jgi:hypothetical protein
MSFSSFSFRFSLDFDPEPIEMEGIVDRVRVAVRNTLARSIGAYMKHAPGKRLKSWIGSDSRDTPLGAEGEVTAPYQFMYTLLPGTKRHFIPVGATRGAAARVQKRRGYPLRFYWERMGRWVRLWSVDHPGYRGDTWDIRALVEDVSPIVNMEMDSVWEYISSRWAGQGG